MTRSTGCILGVCITLFFTTASSQTMWFKYAGNPVIDVGSPGSWDDQWAIAGPVIRVQDTLKMWYSGRKNSFGVISIGYAWSTNGGVSWTKHPSPIMAPTQAWEAQSVWQPSVVLEDTLYKMWYNGGSGGGTGGVGFAWSENGMQWTKHLGNPVVTPGPLSWDADNIEGPCVLTDGTGGYKMWYEGVPLGIAALAVGYATAINDTAWGKADSINPVFSPQAGTWEPTWLRSPKVCFDSVKAQYQMWYSAGPPYNTNYRGIGYATSPDGIEWTRASANPVLRSTSGTWDAGGIWSGGVLADSSMYHMWYQAGFLTALRTGYAVSLKGMSFSISTGDTVINSTEDTVQITIRVDDPAALQFSAKIKVKSTGTVIDTVQLFDDGAHGDSLAADGLFSNAWVFPDSNFYSVDFILVLNDTLRFEMDGVTDLITTVSRDESIVPQDYHLSQNFPNPFNPSTKIQFSVVSSQLTVLKIFDMLGREVATLVNEEMRPGSYEATWDAAGFPTGVYFYRLQSGGLVETKKLVLMR